MIVLWLAGCLWAPARLLADSERADAFAIEAHGNTIAGTALVVHHAGEVTLHAIAPTGTDLFEVRVGPGGATVDAADPSLGAWLERMPFHRDLTALYRAACDVERCRYEDFRLVRGASAWRISGPGGAATYAVDAAGGWRLHDRRRGYTLRVIPGEGAP